MIFDTDFFIDLMQNKESAVNKLKDIEERGDSWAIASPTLVELWSGAMRSDRTEKEKEKIREVLGSNLVIDLETYGAMSAGEIHGELVKKGNMVDFVDCMIAGIAVANNEVLLTGNTKHFSRVKNLDLETY